MPPTSSFQRVETQLRATALQYPEAYEEFPWGERVIKVRGKIFVFMGEWKGNFLVSVKLPSSSLGALMLPFAKPSGYGLGKSGWVTATFEKKDQVPVGMLELWIDESYRAIAPKRLSERQPPAAAPATRKKPRKRKAAR